MTLDEKKQMRLRAEQAFNQEKIYGLGSIPWYSVHPGTTLELLGENDELTRQRDAASVVAEDFKLAWQELHKENMRLNHLLNILGFGEGGVENG
jgi:hypothetical protein